MCVRLCVCVCVLKVSPYMPVCGALSMAVASSMLWTFSFNMRIHVCMRDNLVVYS
jgi:hypothetical protein